MTTANDLLLALSRAYVLSETRGSDDAELLEAYDDVRDLHHALGWQVVRVGETSFSVSGDVVPAEEGDPGRLRDALARVRIQELRLQEALEPEVLDAFFRRLQPSGEGASTHGPERFRGMEELLGLSFSRGDGPLRGMPGSIEALFHPSGWHVRDPDSMPRAASPSGTGGEPSEHPLSRPVLTPALRGKVEAFLSTTGPKKERLASEILAEARRMREARDLNRVADLLEVLVEPRGGEPDPEGQALARRIIYPAVASRLVARLGATREEGDRDRLVQITSGLGKEMALALSDALVEARDRYQRRSFLGALSAQGSLALEMARDMVEDPRWFVVRNGVSLLGEAGGEEAVSHLTGPLANSDARVRRETVLALAKVGGADAEQLLLGMLDDSEPEVRAMVCRAVGTLRVQKALRPLLQILEKDQDEDVQVECLQALGKLGDPGAVPLIEKRGLGGLFSRPGKDVRIAAYRALAGIGTPHARKLLEKAANDSDAGVRAVVQGLLD